MYLTLLSWRQSDLFPGNDGGAFVTKFDPPIVLPEGKWETALTSLHYPAENMENITAGDFAIQIPVRGQKPEVHRLTIPSGKYANMHDICRRIKEKAATVGMKGINFTTPRVTRRVTVKIPPGVVLKLRNELAVALGFRTPDDDDDSYFNLRNDVIATNDWRLNANFLHINIACDIIDHQYHGAQRRPFLRTIGRGDVGDFTRLEYRGVKSNIIEQIAIALCDDDCVPRVPFDDELIVCGLHFRKCQ